MKRDPYLWKKPATGVWYVVCWAPPLYAKRRYESLKTRDRRTAEDRYWIWKRRREREEELGIRLGISIGQTVEEYLKHQALRLTATSVARYRAALDHVLAFLGDDLPVASLDAQMVQDYVVYRAPRAKPATVDYEVDALRAMLNWCRKRRWVKANVASKELVARIDPKREAKRRMFTDAELEALLAVEDPKYPQLGVIFSVLYYTGMRIGELGHLQKRDVSLPSQEIRIRPKRMKIPIRGSRCREVDWRPKNGKARLVPIESRLRPVLEAYERTRLDNVWDLYFTSLSGQQVTDHLSRHVQRVTASQDVSVHTFRHTHISHALNRWGRNPSVVQQWVGHRKLETTMLYLHVGADDLHREAGKTGVKEW